MAMPWANLQEYRSYLPGAEASGEPVVLPFLFLLQDYTSPKMLQRGMWDANERGANSRSVWQLLG